MSRFISEYLGKTSKAAPLAAFRILFGIMMFISIVRFWLNGWIEKLYIEPKFFFKYYGFEFVKDLGSYTYLLFIVCALSSLLVAIGYKYRFSIIVFFLSFTYIELIDLTTYLNHYYFISILSFLMIFLPANTYFSVDSYLYKNLAFEEIPKWSLDAVKILISIVYFYAGLAKLNSDWLVNAMPLSIWLPSAYDLPLIGALLQKKWIIYLFSWGGALYDLFIPFLLFYRPTRFVAFLLVILFHLLTRALFPIGMFPYIMIVSALIFFDAKWHEKGLELLGRLTRIPLTIFQNGKKKIESFDPQSKFKLLIIACFFLFQLLFPFRYLLYHGELFWTEEGYRFSWRVMLMEKAGYANFKILESVSGKEFYVENSQFLSSFQEKQMSTQADMILQYAHFLQRYYISQGLENPQIFVESYVALNGRQSKPYIDPKVDLSQIKDSFSPKTFILDFDDDIKGL